MRHILFTRQCPDIARHRIIVHMSFRITKDHVLMQARVRR